MQILCIREPGEGEGEREREGGGNQAARDLYTHKAETCFVVCPYSRLCERKALSVSLSLCLSLSLSLSLWQIHVFLRRRDGSKFSRKQGGSGESGFG